MKKNKKKIVKPEEIETRLRKETKKDINIYKDTIYK